MAEAAAATADAADARAALASASDGDAAQAELKTLRQVLRARLAACFTVLPALCDSTHSYVLAQVFTTVIRACCIRCTHPFLVAASPTLHMPPFSLPG